ncbi:MAG: DUF2147 domain-containing protein [Brumimicrobium sp.]|nr:DUF2147 domain-containing protein [Brumimicrobium sp.]
MSKRIILFIFLSFIAIGYSQGKSCVGIYETFDDNTNEKQSKVEFYKKNGKLYAKMLHLYSFKGYPSNDPSCDKCTDDRKGKKVIGIEFVRDLNWTGSIWEGGTICNTQDGKIYKLKVWLNPNNQDELFVRVFLGPFYRTQTWRRINN